MYELQILLSRYEIVQEKLENDHMFVNRAKSTGKL